MTTKNSLEELQLIVSDMNNRLNKVENTLNETTILLKVLSNDLDIIKKSIDKIKEDFTI
jgi:chromosome segregation ATPase